MFVLDRLLYRVTGEQRRYTTLLWSLLVLFFAYPIMSQLGLSRFWSLLFIAELLLAVYAISEGKKTLMIAFALVAPAVLGELSFFLFENQETHWFAFVSVTVFLAYVSAVIYKTSVFGSGKVTMDRVAGAISVYFLLGLLWSLAYGIVSAVNPGAFNGIEAFSVHRPGAQEEFLYFSFVTLTTLGYGDMAPVSSIARTLAWVEAVFGQLYLAVTIARLVSLEVTHNTQPPAAD
jgi:hypothetical protein